MKTCWTALIILAITTNVLYGMNADELTHHTRIAGGLCAFPMAAPEDAKLALELAQRPSFVVHAQSAEAGVVARLRATAETAGVLGRSLYVEQGTPATLPYADGSVDLLVADRLRDGDLTPDFRSACLRALIPGRGVALIGRSREGGSGLTKKTLQAWIKDLPQATISDDNSGLWALIRIERPTGMDEWSHRWHGAENMKTSSDTTFRPPYLTQWWGMPRTEGFWGTTVVAANGRMFTLRGGRYSIDWNETSLIARSLRNGVVLWQRSVHGVSGKKHAGYITGRSCLVAESNTLFLVDRDGVLCLDAETGAERGRIAGPKPGGQIKWMACVGGLLAIMAGEEDQFERPHLLAYAENPIGRALAVHDIAAKKELWHDTTVGDIDERMLAVRDARLYALVQGEGVVCRELRTGKTIWTNPDTVIQSLFLKPELRATTWEWRKAPGSNTWKPPETGYLLTQPVLSALDDVLLLQWRMATNTVVLSRADGRMLWKGPADCTSPMGGINAVAIDDYFLSRNGVVNLKDGQLATPPKYKCDKFNWRNCGTPVATTSGYLITCFGAVMNLKTGITIRPEDTKSICDIGQIIAEGVMVAVPSDCICNRPFKGGYRALGSAPAGFDPHAAPSNPQTRLTVQTTKEPEPLTVTDADWPTYRHDAQRSASSTASVGAQPKVLWRWTPAGAGSYTNLYAPGGTTNAYGPPNGGRQRMSADFLPTAPVAVAGRVWFGSADGVVRCVNAADGKEIWKFATDSMLFAPPTIWQGRVLIGGGDGRVYCLDATTGLELWRFQAAPIERRLFWFGHYISTWPVISGVVVRDGVAYAVAGFQNENGIHAYALDPKNGQVRWERHDAGAAGTNQAYCCDGIAAAGGDRLWIPGMTSFPGPFDLHTGDWKPPISGILDDTRFGGGVAIFNNKWMLQGGPRFSETQDTLTTPQIGKFTAKLMEAPFSRVVSAGTMLPAWDADFVVMPPWSEPWRGTGVLTGLSSDKLLAWLTAASAKPDPAAASKPPTWYESRIWASDPMTPIAFALAKNQVVAAYKKDGKYYTSGFNRADGVKIWTVALPEQPVISRLALDRNGRVLVALCDGSVVCLD